MQQPFRIWQLSYWSYTWRTMSYREKRFFIAGLLVHFLLTFVYFLWQGPTIDETDYFGYVVKWAEGKPHREFSIMDSKTPMVAWSLIPAIFKSIIPAGWQSDPYFFLLAGRPFMYVYQVLGAFVTSLWMYRKCGKQRWMIPWLFFIFDPLVFVYGMIIGSDLASASLLVTAMYLCWRYWDTKLPRYWYGLTIVLGLAVVTKASMLFAYPLVLLIFLIKAIRRKTFSYKSWLWKGTQFVLIQLLIINVAYYFNGSFTSFGAYTFESDTYLRAQHAFKFLHAFPVPFPAPFVQGLDMLQHHAEIGGCKAESTYKGVYLLHQLRCNGSVWYYYAVMALFKFPLLIWMFIVLFSWRFVRSKSFFIEKIASNIFIYAPLVFFFLVLSITNRFQIGIRHALILYPFLYLAIANTINWFFDRFGKNAKILLFLHAVSVLHFFPNLMAYTNEFILNKTMAYQLIRDSSLDYGQGNRWVTNFLKKHPDYKRPTNKPAVGNFAITINELYADQEGEKKDIAWLRNNFEPDGNYRYTILLFKITPQDLQEKGVLSVPQ